MCYQANADCAPRLVTVVCSHSRIADVDITVVQEHGVVVHGVQLLQIIPGADIGDTAGVEEVLIFLAYNQTSIKWTDFPKLLSVTYYK